MGCGKSHQALLLVLKYKDDPNFRGVFIRQTSTQLNQAGGLFMEAQRLWKPFGVKFKVHPQMTAIFPSGAQVQFKVMGADRDTSSYDGGQFSLVVFDECQWHTWHQVNYLESRIRSNAKAPHQLIATCNPLRTSFLLNFVEPYLDESGIPIPELSGKERYYATHNGSLITGDTIEELTSKYGEGVKPQSYTFIAANIYHNPDMIKANPSYLTRLENLRKVERERLLLGSWYAKEENSTYFNSDWVEIVDRPPVNPVSIVRSWDLASTVPSESNRNPDWTAGVRMSRDKFGMYYVEDVYRFRKTPDAVLQEIIKTSRQDGEGVQVTIPRDSGSGAAMAASYQQRTLAENGIPAKTVKISGHSGKIQRFLPLATLAESGSLKIVRGEWNSEFLSELEAFDGSRNIKDD